MKYLKKHTFLHGAHVIKVVLEEVIYLIETIKKIELGEVWISPKKVGYVLNS